MLNFLDKNQELFIKVKEIEGIRKTTLDSYKKTFSFGFKQVGELDYSNLERDVLSIFTELSKVDIMGRQVYENSNFNTKRKIYNTFFNWLLKRNIISYNPIKTIPIKAKKEKIAPNPANTDELSILIKNIPLDTYVGFRDYCFVMLLVDTGIRPSEAVKLKIENFKTHKNIIEVDEDASKTKKSRILPLTPMVKENLAKLIKISWDFFGERDYIFLTEYGSPCKTYLFQKNLKRYCDKIKDHDIHITPYMLRHYFGTEFYTKSNGDIYYLQALMGHSKLSTTQRYIKLNQDTLIKVHKKNSPLKNVIQRNTRARKMVKY